MKRFLISKPQEESQKKQRADGVITKKIDIIPITNGAVRYDKGFLPQDEADALFEHLMKVCKWEQGEIPMYGKKFLTPRKQSWMADADLPGTSLYQKQEKIVWTPEVSEVKKRLESLLGRRFNYVLFNLYRDGKDYISWHADKEAIPEDKNIVASVSLGATRRFLLKHNISKETLEYSLTNGSLITMEGEIQQYWKHTVPKEAKVTTPRINLTFRTS
eukprot:TRINITY_DN9830_c0_g1_i2.p1 TRINITY_DN9830_c0_g1~~TRINITY_DN9830_c0_g1_i2.p1  ORF type:complete len:217 (-),score=41.03 TRINITY_DN9830_c0_g1_i2:120-770(-)